jgi:2-polyprenyl-3-methyl-5-hydroxy-6-metoxy-1,4-benzoquinol methylase
MSVRVRWISCNACGASAFRELSVVSGWHLGRCGNCSLTYLNPMPFFEPSAEFSEMSLDFQYTRFQHNVTQALIEHDRRQMQAQLALVSRLAGRTARAGWFLDVGCGSGASVRAAADMGWNAVGIDIDPALVKLGRERFDADLRCTPLIGSGLPGGRFHFIRLRDVIEHLPNPYEVLVEVKRLLVPGGVVLIATPNEDALAARLRLLLGGRRDRVAAVAPPHHVHGFTPRTLAMTLRRAELEALEIRTATPVDPLYVTARNMESARHRPLVLAWRLAMAVGRGSMLVGWARRSPEPA